MPELPEVETIVADLRPHLVGRTIVCCELAFPTIVRHPEPEEFVDAVAGMRREPGAVDNVDSDTQPRILVPGEEPPAG